jgi:hypothetical protein
MMSQRGLPAASGVIFFQSDLATIRWRARGRGNAGHSLYFFLIEKREKVVEKISIL